MNCKKPKDRPHKLGFKIGGSAKKGHKFETQRDIAVLEKFGTDQSEQALGLLMHCLKVLSSAAGGVAGLSNDTSSFML